MPRRLKIPLISVAVVIGLMLLSMLIVPWQIKKQGSRWIATHTDRTLTIDKAFFNPFTLTVELNGLRLTERQQEKAFVSFKRLMLSASVRSIFDWALIIDRLELDDPFVNIELLGKQEFNFSDFIENADAEPQQPAEPDSGPFLFSLNNIVLTNGSLDFTDQTSALKSQHRIRNFDLSVPFIGNVPYLTDEYVQPQLKMLLNGALLQATGQLKPFHNSLETTLSMSLEGADLAWYAYHSPVPLPIDVKEGDLDCEIDLDYRISANAEPILMLGGMLALTDIDLREPDGAPLLSLPTLILDLDWANLLKQDFNLASLEIHEPQVHIDRDDQGLWNLQSLFAAPVDPSQAAQPQPAPEDPEPAKLPLVTVEALRLIDGQVHFRDAFVAAGFREDFNAVNLSLDHLSTHPGALTTADFRLQSARGSSAAISGQLGLAPLTAELTLKTEKLGLQPLYPYAEPFLNAALQGTLSLDGQVSYLEDGNVRLNQGRLLLNDIVVPFAGSDRLTLTELAVEDTSFDLRAQTLRLENLRLSGADITFSKLQDGSLSPLKLLKPGPQTAARPAQSEPAEDPQPWDVQLENLDLEQFSLAFTDLSLAQQPRVVVPKLDFHAGQLSYPVSHDSPFTLVARIGDNGRIEVSGRAAHSPLKLAAETVISDFPLSDFNDFIPEGINLSLKDGRLYSAVAVKLEQKAGTLSGSFSGKTDVTRFNLRDPLGDGQLLAWDSLNVDGIAGTFAPLAVHVKEVALSNYLANIQITGDGRINLASIAEQQESHTPPPAEEQTVETERQDTASGPEIRIDALTLQGGTVSFVDRSMENLFSATMYELGGRITGMASDEQMRADVDLRGQLENHSPLTVSGQINPLSKDLFADLTISFNDIDLTPMTPYSGTYLGYVIDKGKLYLDLSYHIEKRKIEADNKILIDQFTLGDTVKSDKAVALPISLAIALLKDNNDEIHLDVPVRGDLDDPDFSVVGVIFTVIKNLMVKAATSPFSLLTSMLGSGNEDFSSIDFGNGLATIDAGQRKKLQTLAGMLAKRPSLTLEISAYADRDNDPEAFRREQLRQMLLTAKRNRLLDQGQQPAPDLTYSAEEYPDLIRGVYEEAQFPRPRTFVGTLKDLPVEEMEKLLLANIMAGDEEIAELAKQRALTVRDTLVAANEAIKPRIFLKKTDIYQAAEEGPDSRVEFSISTK